MKTEGIRVTGTASFDAWVESIRGPYRRVVERHSIVVRDTKHVVFVKLECGHTVLGGQLSWDRRRCGYCRWENLPKKRRKVEKVKWPS